MGESLDANSERNQEICKGMIEKSLQRNPTVKFMIEALQKAGCPVTQNFFKSESCSVEAGGGFVPQIGGEVDQILTHELVHAYDHCRAANLDWSDCQHHACSELGVMGPHLQQLACMRFAVVNAGIVLAFIGLIHIRAANLSGDCKWTLELLRGHTNIRQQQQVCVRRRAQLSVCMNPHCSEKDAKKAVDSVWKTCYNDTKPFDRAP